MKISLKYKLLVIIVFLFLILIFCSTLITYFYTARHQENFFVNKLSKKQASYQKKNELIKNVFSELSEEMRNLYKRNIENDFREFYFSLENSLIIESLQAQTEALAQLANKYKTENFAILEEKGIIQIANDINLWNKPILSFLETKNIKLNENLKDFVCSEYENYFVITAKLKVKNRKFNIYFFVNIQELLKFKEPQKNKILENI
ncbi:MAG TPA: hypothetical protein PLM75_10745, partial [bacterium]|nr:hypothetical protein [bacterium]